MVENAARSRSRPAPQTSGQQGGGRISGAASRQPAEANQNQAPQSDTSWMKTGDEARLAAQREQERQEARRRERQNTIFAPRFFLKPGEQADIILLDEGIGPCFYEHDLTWEPGYKKTNNNGKPLPQYEPCPKEFEPCPLCEAVKESYYVMFFSIIEMNPPGTDKPFIRKLLPVKHQQQGFFLRLADRHNGNVRGVHLLMTRDTKDQAKIGFPEHIATYGEQDIQAEFQHGPVYNQQNEQVKEANADLHPFDYGRLFHRPDAEHIRQKFGFGGAPGSGRQVEDEWGGHNPAPANDGGGQPAQQPQQGRQAGSRIAGASNRGQTSGSGTGQQSAPAGNGGGQAAQTDQPGQQTQEDQAPDGGGGIQTRSRGRNAPTNDEDLDDEIPF